MTPDSLPQRRRTGRLHCPICGREDDGSAADQRRYAVAGFPQCCGAGMTPDGEPPPVVVSSRQDRLGRRWVARAGARADVRRAQPGREPDLGAGLVDVSADGVCVRLTAPMETGEAVLIGLRPKGGRRLLRLRAEIRWCRPVGGGLYLAGLRLARPLTAAEVAHLVR